MTGGRQAVFFVPGYRPQLLGIGRFIPQYVDALAAAGWRVDVRAPYPWYPAWREDRSVPRICEEHDGQVRITRYRSYVPQRQNAVTRALNEASIGASALHHLRAATRAADLIVAASPPLLGAAAATWYARRRRRPLLILAFDLVSDLAGDAFGSAGGALGRGAQRLERAVYARADRVIVLSDDMAARIESLAGRPAHVIRLWMDDELGALDHGRAGRQFRARLGIADRAPLIGFAGAFGRKQQLGTVLDALRGLPDEYEVIFVGDGPDRHALAQRVDGHARHVRLLPPLPAADLHGFLSACDLSVVVAWTRHAGSLFPSKVANILAAGSPLLAITHPDTELARLIERDRLGVVCPSLEPRAIREAARRAVETDRDPERRARCRAFARRHFDRAQAMARFLGIVAELTAGAAR